MNHTVRKESELMRKLWEYCPQVIEKAGQKHSRTQWKMRLLGKLLDVVVSKKTLTLEPDLNPHKSLLATLQSSGDQSGIVVLKPLWKAYFDPELQQSYLIFRVGGNGREQAERILKDDSLEESRLIPTINALRETSIYLRCSVQTALSVKTNRRLIFMIQPGVIFDWLTSIDAPSVAFWQREQGPCPYQDLKRPDGPVVTVEDFLAIYSGMSSLERYIRRNKTIAVNRYR